MGTSKEPLLAAAGGRDDGGAERLTPRQARVFEVLAGAGGAPVNGEALAAQLGVRAGSLSVTLRSLQRRGLIAAASERAQPSGWVLRGPP